MSTNNLIVVLCTVPNQETARTIASALVEERLAACVNIVPEVNSIFRWKDTVDSANELLLICKTPSANYPALEKRIQELHPYDTPEVLALQTCAVLDKYLLWAEKETA